MEEGIESFVLDALARYEVQTRWPSLRPDMVEQNVSLIRGDAEIVRSARTAVAAIESLGSGAQDACVRRDEWRRTGFEAAAKRARGRSDHYAAYGLSPHSLERHVEEMLRDLSPPHVETVVSPVKVVRTALARDAVARQWPDLREDMVETNVRMMTSDRQIVRHAELAVSISRSARHAAHPETADQENRDLLHFQQAVEAASRYFVTLSARHWRPQTIGWAFRAIAEDVKRTTPPE